MNASIKFLVVAVILLAALLGAAVAMIYLEGGSPLIVRREGQGQIWSPSITPQLLENSLQRNIIRVSGFGSSSSTPDMAYAMLAVETIAETAHKAQTMNAAKMNSVLSALKAKGITEDEIETIRYSINPNYDYESKPPRILSYTCRNEVKVTITKIELVGSIIDAAVEAGANRVTHIEFTLSAHLREQLAKKALESAVRDAETKARTIAEALNLEIKGPIQVDIQTGMPIQPYVYRAETMVGIETPITPGEVQITAAVTIIFAYK